MTRTPATERPRQDRADRDRDAKNVFVYEVEEVTYQHDRPRITGAEIMAEAGISEAEGLVQLLPDGTAVTIAPDDVVKLVPKAQFKRRPKFKRG